MPQVIEPVVAQMMSAENTHRWGKHLCTAGLQFNKTGTDQ